MPTLSSRGCAHFPSAQASFNRVPKHVSPAARLIPRVASGGFSGFSGRADRYSIDAGLDYGEDAPNTGYRTMPPAELGRQARAVAKFPQRTIVECYNDFPGEVKSSCPFTVTLTVPEPVDDSDPSTGHRHRPDPEQERFHVDESMDEAIEANRRWLSARREVV